MLIQEPLDDTLTRVKCNGRCSTRADLHGCIGLAMHCCCCPGTKPSYSYSYLDVDAAPSGALLDVQLENLVWNSLVQGWVHLDEHVCSAITNAVSSHPNIISEVLSAG